MALKPNASAARAGLELAVLGQVVLLAFEACQRSSQHTAAAEYRVVHQRLEMHHSQSVCHLLVEAVQCTRRAAMS